MNWGTAKEDFLLYSDFDDLVEVEQGLLEVGMVLLVMVGLD